MIFKDGKKKLKAKTGRIPYYFYSLKYYDIYTDYCFARCAAIEPNIQPGCTLKTDPRDACCLAQVCTEVTPTPGPGSTNGPTQVPTLKPNLFTGQVYIPTPSRIPGQPIPTPAKLGNVFSMN